MSSDDPILDGQPISQLKVVDLRRELDRFGLPKAGNKKDLFERLRDHLNGNDGGGQEAPTEANEAESASRPSTRSSASPRKSSPTKATTPAKSQSPTKTPPVNRFVAQYLQSQQASLEENKRGRAASSEKTDDSEKNEDKEKSPEPTEVKSPEPIKVKSPEPIKSPIKVKSPEPIKSPIKVKSPEPIKVKSPEPIKSPIKVKSPEPIKSPIKVKSPEPIKVKSPEPIKVKSPEPVVEKVPEPAPIVTKAEVLSALNFPRSERDEGSSTISNAGSESAPQTIADDGSIEEGKAADEPMDSKTKEPTPKEESPKKSSPVKKQASPSSSSSESKSSSEDEEEVPAAKEPEEEHKESKPVIVASVDEPTGVELDYEEDEPAPKASSPVAKQESKDEDLNAPATQSSEVSTPPENTKKHRAIVFDLDENAERKSGDAPAPKSTKTTISIRPTVTAKPPEGTPESEINSLGNVRARPVSPSTHEPTQYIHITHLKRPYVVTRLQAVLRTFGEFADDDFWIDNLRSNCMVKYDSVEAATKARDEMHNIKWPDAHSQMINADYITEEKFQSRRGESSSQRKPSGDRSGFIIHVANDRKDSIDGQADSVKSDGSRKRKSSPESLNTKPLEELFKKTKVRPYIYYLPLTEEQVAEKKQRLQK